MSDYISRESAKKAACEALCHPGVFCPDFLCKEVREKFDSIPAADVRPVEKAHWYWDEDGMDWGIGSWRCSACHSRPETWWQGDRSNPRNKSGHYFCPNCGADMREES